MFQMCGDLILTSSLVSFVDDGLSWIEEPRPRRVGASGSKVKETQPGCIHSRGNDYPLFLHYIGPFYKHPPLCIDGPSFVRKISNRFNLMFELSKTTEAERTRKDKLATRMCPLV